ncbi:MAG: adenylate/guanylate cyclase domain-containing protein [Magnetococcales bacterium]|nr:adenylate/guanylate cyclase domain-containing protein [Magnetococcales bacterium]
MDGVKLEREYAVLFADIAGSTALFSKIGAAKARKITSECMEILRKVIHQNGGRFIKEIGDESMSIYPTVDQACNAAISMHEMVKDSREAWGHEIYLRIGFEYGVVIDEGKDVFGDAANLASRFNKEAEKDEIITSVKNVSLANADRFKFRELNKADIKGKEAPITLCELTWGDNAELTRTRTDPNPGVPEMDPAPFNIQLRYKNQMAELNRDKRTIGFGKEMNNDIVFNKDLHHVSRLHGYLHLDGEILFLEDKSTNGTIFLSIRNNMTHIYREKMVIGEDGVIVPGEKPAKEIFGNTDELEKIRKSPESIHLTSSDWPWLKKPPEKSLRSLIAGFLVNGGFLAYFRELFNAKRKSTALNPG